MQSMEGQSASAFERAVSAFGRIVWTLFAFVFLVVVWAAMTQALLGEHQAWAYLVFAVATLVFIAAVAGLRAVWRDARYW